MTSHHDSAELTICRLHAPQFMEDLSSLGLHAPMQALHQVNTGTHPGPLIQPFAVLES